MNMATLFSTPERERILEYFLYQPKEKMTMRQIARELSLSPALIHKYVTLLRKFGLLKGMEMQNTPLVCSLRLTQNILRFRRAGIAGILKKKIPGIKGVGFFGSWAKGTNDMDSDLDIWIKVEEEPELLLVAETRKDLEKKMKVDIDMVVIDEKKIIAHREKNPPFYFSLYNSIVLWGVGI